MRGLRAKKKIFWGPRVFFFCTDPRAKKKTFGGPGYLLFCTEHHMKYHMKHYEASYEALRSIMKHHMKHYEASYNIKRAYVSGTNCDNVAKKTDTQNPSKTLVKRVKLLGKKNGRTRLSRNHQKPLVKQVKRAEGPRYGNNPAAALPSRAQANLQGNPCETNGKQAFTPGAACVAPCTTVPRLSTNMVE